MGNWFPQHTFDIDPIWPERLQVKFRGYGVSTPGSFLADNLKTPTDVLYGDISLNQVIAKLQEAKEERSPYTHVGFSIQI